MKALGYFKDKFKNKKILEEKYLLKIDKNRKENYYTSGNPDNMKRVARAILNSFEYSVEKVKF